MHSIAAKVVWGPALRRLWALLLRGTLMSCLGIVLVVGFAGCGGPARERDEQAAAPLPVDLLKERGYELEVPALLKAADDPDPRVRHAALKVLYEVGAKDIVIVDLLIRALKDEDPERRLLAARFVREFGPRAETAVPVMREELKTAKGRLRVALAEALWMIGKDVEAAVPALLAEIAEGDEESKLAAGELLKRMGNAAVPVLRRAIEGSQSTRQAAERALGQIEATKEE